jgi:microcompartment protein CcmL/EutN
MQMAKLNSIGLIEVASIALGYVAQDAMLKAAEVELLLARTICSGKYLIVVGGNVASVQAAVDAAAPLCAGALIEKRVIAHVHPDVFPAIGMSVDLEPGKTGALGVIETFSASSIIDVADAAVKSANVILFRIHLAMAIGGKGFVLLTGDIASVDAAVSAGAAIASDEGILVAKSVIAAPVKELFRDLV